MAPKLPIGGFVEVPANDTLTIQHEVQGRNRTISLIELEDTDGSANIQAYVKIRYAGDGGTARVPIEPDAVSSNRPSRTSDSYPIAVAAVVSESRFTMFEVLEDGDVLEFGFENTDSSAHSVRFRAATASAVDGSGGET